MAYVVLGLGIAYSVATKGVQFTRIPDMFRQLRENDGSQGGLSSFQALVLALASRVGVGSIAGVATANFAGGPGALLWMAVTGLVGCIVGYAEATLSQTFKRQVQDEDRKAANEDIGGMPYYIKYGLRLPKIGAMVALLGVIGYGVVFPGFQVNTIAASAELAFNVPTWIPAILVTAMIAAVIFGGTTRLVKVTQLLVPVLAIGYLLLALTVIALNWAARRRWWCSTTRTLRQWSPGCAALATGTPDRNAVPPAACWCTNRSPRTSPPGWARRWPGWPSGSPGPAPRWRSGQ